MIQYKISSYFLIFFLICLSVCGCMKEPAEASLDKRVCFVRRVIDGDTIELSDGRLVRYIGIDTPEIRRRRGASWEYEPQPYSLQAKDYNKVLVSDKQVELEYDVQKQDKYGRRLAYVYAGGKMANEELLRQGYAKLLTIPPNTRYFNRLKSAEEEAKRAGRGIWQKK